MEYVNEFLYAQPAWHWWALGAVLIALEMISTTQYLLWPGIGAVLVGVLTFFMPGIDGRLAVFLFAVFSVAATYAWKHSAWGRTDNAPQHPTLNRRTEQYVGRIVKAATNFTGGRGAVLVDDTRWNAAVIDGSAPIAGDSLVVEAAEGTVLKVKLVPGSLLFGGAPQA
jgi:membrane protein implicated in regulation of membrane protease activity